MISHRPKVDLLFVALVVSAVAGLASLMPTGTAIDRKPPTYAPTPDHGSLQLVEWYNVLRDPVVAIPGVWSSGLRPERNQIEYSVEDEKAMRAIDRVLEEMQVPRDAVLIRIGAPPELRHG